MHGVHFTGGDADRAPQRLGLAGRPQGESLSRIRHLTGMFQQLLAGWGKPQPATHAIKQVDPKLLGQRLDLAPDGGLREAQGGRRG